MTLAGERSDVFATPWPRCVVIGGVIEEVWNGVVVRRELCGHREWVKT